MKQLRLKKWLPMLAVSALLLVVVVAASQTLGNRSGQENLTVLQRSVQRAAVQCYALEGFYPSNLSYLQEHYGISYDEDSLYIAYQYIASNLMPDIIVLPRG